MNEWPWMTIWPPRLTELLTFQSKKLFKLLIQKGHARVTKYLHTNSNAQLGLSNPSFQCIYIYNRLASKAESNSTLRLLFQMQQPHLTRMLACSLLVSMIITSLLTSRTSGLVVGHSLNKRSFFEIQCKGVYDKSIFARLDRICEDCYNLFREPQLHSLCRYVLFSLYFTHTKVRVPFQKERVVFRWLSSGLLRR
jgi:hypothetical protein